MPNMQRSFPAVKIQATTRIYRFKLAVNIAGVTYIEAFITSYLCEIEKYSQCEFNYKFTGIFFISIYGLHTGN